MISHVSTPLPPGGKFPTSLFTYTWVENRIFISHFCPHTRWPRDPGLLTSIVHELWDQQIVRTPLVFESAISFPSHLGTLSLHFFLSCLNHHSAFSPFSSPSHLPQSSCLHGKTSPEPSHMHCNTFFWFEPMLVLCLNLCFLGWGDDATKICITKSSQLWREIYRKWTNENMKL